jgi:hypothetical protein
MYKVNPLMRNVLITVDEVLFHAPTKQTVDVRMINSSIIIAEERFIVPELGRDLYYDIINAKNVVATTGNLSALQTLVGAEPVLVEGDIVNALEQMSTEYQALWKQHLWKLTAECVLVAAAIEGFVQFGSEGSFHNSPPAGLMVSSGQVTPLLSSMKWTVDKKVKDRIAPLINAMHYWLCKNKADYTYYKKECPDCPDETKETKWSGIALGLYDDDEPSSKCCD